MAVLLLVLGTASLAAAGGAAYVLYRMEAGDRDHGADRASVGDDGDGPLSNFGRELLEKAESVAPEPELTYFRELSEPPGGAVGRQHFIPLDEHIDAAASFHFDPERVPIARGIRRSDFESVKVSGVESLEAPLLVCIAQSHLKHSVETFGGSPEPALRMKFGSHPKFMQRRNSGYFFSAPGVRLEKGDPVAFVLYDQDPRRLQPMGTAKTRFDGEIPIRAKSSKLTVTCWPPQHAMYEERVQIALENAEMQLEALLPELDDAVESLHYPHMSVRTAQRAVGALASLVGWADPRVQRLYGWWKALDAHWAKLATAELERRYRAAAPRGEWRRAENGRVEARLVESSCRPAIYRWGDGRQARFDISNECDIVLEIRNLDAEPLQTHHFFDDGFPEEVSAVHVTGSTIPLRRVGFVGGHRPDAIGSGEVVQMRLRHRMVRPTQHILDTDPGDFRMVTLGTAQALRIDLRLR